MKTKIKKFVSIVLVFAIVMMAAIGTTTQNVEAATKKITSSNSTLSLSWTSKTYGSSGYNSIPTTTVKYKTVTGYKTLTKGTDYTVTSKWTSGSGGTSSTYYGYVGKHTVTISGKGSYSGSLSKTYYIYPKTVSGIKKSSSESGAVLYVQWTHQNGVTKYQVQYKSNKESSWTTTTVGTGKYTNTTSSVSINKSSHKGTYYYVRVRAYSPYTSSWSSSVKITPKYAVT